MFEKKKDADISQPAPVPTSPEKISHSQKPTPNNTATIGPSISIHGDISGEENLVIYGKVDGKITLGKNDVTIGKSGKVTADIMAKVVKIEGEVTGDIAGDEKVVISSTGRVRGNIVAPRMTLEDGAKFKGSIDMDPEESSGAPSKFTAKPGSSNISGGRS